MIKKLRIQNFKSIWELNLDCKKINVFIGEPNSGKSNIIEAMALQSQNAISNAINKAMIRYTTLGDLFFDFNINQPIVVRTDELKTSLAYAYHENGAPRNEFAFKLTGQEENPSFFDHNGSQRSYGDSSITNIRFYEYRRIEKFIPSYMPHLNCPSGDNLPGLLLSNEKYKKWVTDFFSSKGFILTLKPTENDINLSKMVDGALFSYPYFTISETLQRVVFYEMAIQSNKQAVLLFDEPESNTFPFYTKFLAERIALNELNQFFITTHNPYLLLSLIEKSKFEDINICIVQMKDYRTEIVVLDQSQVTQVLDFNSDVFFNFNKILEV